MAQPDIIIIPFARDAAPGYVDVIPETLPPGSDPQYVSYSQGFPPVTMTPLGAGGIPPRGQSFNGVLKDISEHTVFICAGGRYKWSSLIAGDTGYAKGSEVLKESSSGSWVNTLEGNTSNPDSGGAGWEDPNSGRLLSIKTISVSGIYTPTPGISYAKIKGIGGGGGSGSTNATGAAQFAASSGGASGSFFETILTSAQIGAGVSITIGAAGIAAAPNGNGGNGGATIVGSFVSAPGGGGGLVGAPVASTATAATLGGTPGGVATGATLLNSDGVPGGSGLTVTGSTIVGAGAGTQFGAGGRQSIGGSSGTGYGSGAGGVGSASSQAAKPGVAGRPGVVFIEEYS